MEDIISAGVKTKVLLLSATPVNNQLADLRNQISFIAGGDVARNDARCRVRRETRHRLGQGNHPAGANAFHQLGEKTAGQRKTRDLIAAIGGDFFKLLDGLSIARSRRQIATLLRERDETTRRISRAPGAKGHSPAIDLNSDSSPSSNWTRKSAHCISLSIIRRRFLRDDLPADVRAAYENKILGGSRRKAARDPHRHDEGQLPQAARKLRGLVPSHARAHHRQDR